MDMDMDHGHGEPENHVLDVHRVGAVRWESAKTATVLMYPHM